jgi:hypothetical protein
VLISQIIILENKFRKELKEGLSHTLQRYRAAVKAADYRRDVL